MWLIKKEQISETNLLVTGLNKGKYVRPAIHLWSVLWDERFKVKQKSNEEEEKSLMDVNIKSRMWLVDEKDQTVINMSARHVLIEISNLYQH